MTEATDERVLNVLHTWIAYQTQYKIPPLRLEGGFFFLKETLFIVLFNIDKDDPEHHLRKSN